MQVTKSNISYTYQHSDRTTKFNSYLDTRYNIITMTKYSSPFSQAIFLMFDNLETWLKSTYNDLSPGAIKVYVFGGCAMHLHTGIRTSNDLDAEIEAVSRLRGSKIIIQAVDFIDESGLPSILEYDRNFSITLAPIHPDYKERATILNAPSLLVHLYLISPVDLAVSKLGRLGDIDLEDIVNLHSQKLFTIEEFITATHEAGDYYINPRQLQSNLDYVVSFL